MVRELIEEITDYVIGDKIVVCLPEDESYTVVIANRCEYNDDGETGYFNCHVEFETEDGSLPESLPSKTGHLHSSYEDGNGFEEVTLDVTNNNGEETTFETLDVVEETSRIEPR